MERKKIILLSTSQSAFDQRIQKIALSLYNFGADVLWISRKLSNTLIETPYKQKQISCWFNSGVLFYLEFNLRLFFTLLKIKATYITANDADSLPSVILLSWFKRFTLVYDSHEIFTEVPELENKKIKKKVWGSIEKIGIKKAAFCYTVNESLSRILEEKYHKKFTIVKNVPYKNTEQNHTVKENYILYQGALNKGRGLEQIITCMPQINAQLLLAGKGDLELELKHQVTRLQLEKKGKFLGNILPTDLKIITEKASIGLNLLENKSLNYYYSLANKFFDYIQAETPQICMNFPEYQKINQEFHVAILIDDLKKTTLVNTINNLLQDKELYKKIEENCCKAKETYVWEKEEQILKEIYK